MTSSVVDLRTLTLADNEMVPSTTDDSTTERRPTRRRKASTAARFGWGLYEQAMAVLAAFGVAAIIDQFWQIGWRGFLQFTVGIWERTVQPAVAWLCHILVTVPLGWIGVHIAVPEWFRDYISVGLILGLSIARMQRNDRAPLRALFTLDRSDLLSSLAFWLPLIVVLWPLHLLLYLAMFWMSALNPSTRDSSVSKSMAAAISPLLYLGLLLAVNYLVL